jgi:cytochrome b subunit of formate dehydrogenase
MNRKSKASGVKTYVRFDILQRIQHLLFLISFSLLGFTGLPQKFPLSPISVWIFKVLGGVETVRLIHHSSAIVMMIVSIYHVLEILYRVFVLKTPITMIPWINDIQHVYEDVLYYLGLRKHMGYYGRYSYAEKVEYLALVWGTIVMGLTGFVMWNPISSLRIMPGEMVPAAKAAHGGEAILAVLAIIIWHFYHVHIKHFNKSMFTGKLSHEEMKHEHPAELARIEEGGELEPIPAKVLRKRQAIYAPIALVILALFSYGFYYFVGYEQTAVVSPNLQPTLPIYVPQTATPQPTPTSNPSSSSLPVTGTLTWDANIGPLFAGKCLACHGGLASGGLNLSTYADAMKGGVSGIIFNPGDAANSLIITKFESGKHSYAVLLPDELAMIVAWLESGALEK